MSWARAHSPALGATGEAPPTRNTRYRAHAMEIKNTTNRPLKIKLPAGKRLFLGIGGTGQITPKSAEHPPVKKLIEDGDLEITDSANASAGGGTSHEGGVRSAQGSGGGSSIRQSGDR